MVFNPLYKWPTKGPFTSLIGMFLGSDMQLSSKISVFAYICSCKSLPKQSLPDDCKLTLPS